MGNGFLIFAITLGGVWCVVTLLVGEVFRRAAIRLRRERTAAQHPTFQPFVTRSGE